MSNPTNNKLKDFLQKSDSEPLDDFEKDALEGFYTLSSEQEALDAKTQLDKRIYSEVFTENKSNKKVYWFAAAGLFLVIGLSIFFILNNDSFINKKDMALVTPNETNKIEGKLMEDVEAEKTLDKQDAIPAEQKESFKNEKSPSTPSKAEEKNIAGKASGPGASEGVSSSINKDDGVPAPTKKAADISLAQSAAKDKIETTSEDVKNEESELKPEISANEKSKGGLGEIASNVPSLADELKKEARSESKSKRKKESQKSNATTKSPSEAASENTDKDDYANNRAASREDNDAKAKPTGVPAAPSSEPITAKADVSSPCYYAGGESNLIKEVREKLIEKKLNKPFEAILFINDKKVVEKVSFTKLYNLNKDEETHIREILKDLNKFNFSNNLPLKNLFEYKLLYKP